MFDSKQKYIILLADDDYLNHLYYREILPQEDFDIIYVTNGRDAIAECKNNPDIDLVLMDIRMPEIDGLMAIRKIRTFNPQVAILVQSAFLTSEDLIMIKKINMLDYISKPVKEDELLRKISHLIGVNCDM